MRGEDSGFTLLEVVIALFLIAVSVIALAPLFVYASRENASAGQLGSAEARAVERMELLRATPFAELDNGGDLAADVADFFDASSPDHTVRWTIADRPGPPASAKVITVRATAVGPTRGAVREAVLVTLRGN